MRPGDCKARSTETKHPPLAPHRGLTQLIERQLGPAQPSSAQLSPAQLGSVQLHLTLVCVINVFTASSSALGLSVNGLGSFVAPLRCCLPAAPLASSSSAHFSCLVLGNEQLTSLELCRLNAVHLSSLFLVYYPACQELRKICQFYPNTSLSVPGFAFKMWFQVF